MSVWRASCLLHRHWYSRVPTWFYIFDDQVVEELLRVLLIDHSIIGTFTIRYKSVPWYSRTVAVIMALRIVKSIIADTTVLILRKIWNTDAQLEEYVMLRGGWNYDLFWYSSSRFGFLHRHRHFNDGELSDHRRTAKLNRHLYVIELVPTK